MKRKVFWKCSFCNQFHTLKIIEHNETLKIKGQLINCKVKKTYCFTEKKYFETIKQMNDNLQVSRDAYRLQNNLLTSKEMISFRNENKLNYQDISNLLNNEYNSNEIELFEKKKIQNEDFDNKLRYLYNKYNFL